jgi:hypothetical protein
MAYIFFVFAIIFNVMYVAVNTLMPANLFYKIILCLANRSSNKV